MSTITRADGTKHGRDAFLAVYRGFRDSDVRSSKHVVTNVQAFPEERRTGAREGVLRRDDVRPGR